MLHVSLVYFEWRHYDVLKRFSREYILQTQLVMNQMPYASHFLVGLQFIECARNAHRNLTVRTAMYSSYALCGTTA